MVIGHPNGTTQIPGSVDVPDALIERFAAFEGRYTIVKNITNTALKTQQLAAGIGSAHTSCFHGFLSGHVHPAEGQEHQTFDQIIAEDPMHQGVKASSISINCWKRPSATSGVPQQWYNTWAWKGPGQPVPAHHDPRALFELLFSEFEPAEDPVLRQRLERKRLFLDSVIGQIHDLGPRLGSEDQIRLDQYLTGVHELDKKTVEALDGGVPLQCAVGEPPDIELPDDTVTTSPAQYPQVIEMMQDLVVLALQCDATRLVTFAHASPGGGGNSVLHPFLEFEGATNAWHPLSHWNAPYGPLSEDLQLNFRDFERILAWHYDRVANFVQKLDDTMGAGGRSLLDDTLVSFGSWQEGAVHRVQHLYQVLFGSAGGRFKEGAVISANPGVDPGSVEISDLWLTVMQGFGLDVQSLGGASTGVPELLV